MRLFFSLWPPAEQAKMLAALAGDCACRFGGRATRQETIHLTLAFLGQVPGAQLHRLVQRAQSVQTTGFDLCIDRLGYWRHNRLLWAGCSAVPDSLRVLAEDLQAVLCEAGIPLDAAAHGFTPHLTLVRKLPEKSVSSVLPDIEPICWRSEGFVLVESILSQTGSNYRTIEKFAAMQ